MQVPVYPQEEVIDDAKLFTRPWQIFFETLLNGMQQALSNEGYLVPSVTNDQMLQIQNGLNQNGGQTALPGTLLFNTTEPNGTTTATPNGQLYILLQDGVFHPITNT